MKRLIVIIALLVSPSALHAQSPSFQGKTVTIIVGTAAGDLYDLYARAIALFMGRYLPGNPNVLVQNMPGAGHMIRFGSDDRRGSSGIGRGSVGAAEGRDRAAQ